MTSSNDDPLVTTDWLAAPYRRSQGAHHRCVLQDARRAAVAVGRLSRSAYSGRGVLRRQRDLRSHDLATAYVSGCRAVRARRRRAWHRLGDTVVAYNSGAWVAAPRAWWMFLSFGHRQREGARWRPEEMDARGTPDAFRQGHAEAGEIQGRRSIRASSAASSKCWRNLQTHAEQLVDARPRRRFEGTVAEPWPGSPLGSHSRQPQRALCRAVRRRDRRDEVARASCGRRSAAPAST